ncbi:MAG: IS66 family transposase, partial [Bacilli bacterium]
PKLQFGKAVAYCLNQWEYLSNILLDMTLEVSNNRAERAVKLFVIGRRNWMFSNTANGACTSACLYSIVESAKQNKLNVQDYLEHVIFTMSRSENDKKDIENLLPYSKELPANLILS